MSSGEGDVERHAQDARAGAIRVGFESESDYLSQQLPHVLRNADLRVVDDARGNHVYRVAPGLYSVEALSPSGRQQSFVVCVAAGETAEVTVEHDTHASRSARPTPASPASPGAVLVSPTAAPPAAEADVAHAPVAKEAARPGTVRRAPPSRPARGARGSVCAECGTVNDSARVFCTRCGESLRTVPASPPPPPPGRWRRLWPPFFRRDRAAGRGALEESGSGEAMLAAGDEPAAPPPSAPSTMDVGVLSKTATGQRPTPTPLIWYVAAERTGLMLEDVTLVDAAGCHVESVTGDRLYFVADAHLAEPAHATFRVGGRRVELSLPVHDRAPFPLGGAVVTAVRRPSGSIALVAGFTAERQVATVLDAMSAGGAAVDADAMLREASNLLLHKYADPPAAALGALIMQRLGRLDERERWVSNLAADIGWLPDGKALHASLLRDGADDEQRTGLRLLLDASTQRPLFTDGLSLMINLLRRWPGDELADERRARIEALGALMVTADFDAVCLSVTPTGAED